MFTVCIHVWWGASWCSNYQYHLYHGCSGARFITTLHVLPVSSCRLDSDFLIKINSLWVFGHPAATPACQQQQQQQCGPRSRAHSCGRAALRLPELCCVPLSTAGSAVGPCGGAGRTVRRCLSAASSRKASFSLTSDRKPTGRPKRPHHTSTTAAASWGRWEELRRREETKKKRGDCVMWTGEPAGTLTLTPPKTEVRSGFIRAVDYWTG